MAVLAVTSGAASSRCVAARGTPPATASPAATPEACVTYQLWIEVEHPLCVAIGRFGVCRFPAGRYVYTGSARRNFEARIARHLRQEKKPHWHIDYLLAAPGVRIVDVRRFTVAECAVNQATPGLVTIPGFGATDCRAGCRAHLKYLEGHIETDSLARGDATGRTPSSVRRHRRK